MRDTRDAQRGAANGGAQPKASKQASKRATNRLPGTAAQLRRARATRHTRRRTRKQNSDSVRVEAAYHQARCGRVAARADGASQCPSREARSRGQQWTRAPTTCCARALCCERRKATQERRTTQMYTRTRSIASQPPQFAAVRASATMHEPPSVRSGRRSSRKCPAAC